MNFRQYIEQEKSVKLYGLGAKGQTPGKAIASAVRPASPAKPFRPFSGFNVTQDYSKPRVSGVMGR